MISSVVSTKYTSVTDKRTDTARELCICVAGKNVDRPACVTQCRVQFCVHVVYWTLTLFIGLQCCCFCCLYYRNPTCNKEDLYTLYIVGH